MLGDDLLCHVGWNLFVTGEFHFVNAGHEMPMISRAGQPFERHKIRPGFVLAGMEGIRYKAGSLTLEPGDKLFQYTDGVTEAMNCSKQLFGEERLLQTISSSNASPKEIVHLICSEVSKFAGSEPQSDDITLLVMEYR